MNDFFNIHFTHACLLVKDCTNDDTEYEQSQDYRYYALIFIIIELIISSYKYYLSMEYS